MNPIIGKPAYLGDGVYVTRDGENLVLKLSASNEVVTDVIVLEPEAFAALTRFAAKPLGAKAARRQAKIRAAMKRMETASVEEVLRQRKGAHVHG